MFLSHPKRSLLPKKEMGEEKVQDLYCNILEATFLISTDVRVNVRAQKIREFLFDELGSFWTQKKLKSKPETSFQDKDSF